jgi:single-strand DNA-binding protein
MNSCVLMGEIVKAPELRFTQDGQTAIAEMTVQFPAIRAEDPMETVKVVSWGNMAQQVQEQYQQGDQIVVEGRLTMSSIDRPEGFKERVAEITASRIHPMSMNAVTTSVPSLSTQGTSAPPPQAASPATVSPQTTSQTAAPIEEPNYDDIPF